MDEKQTRATQRLMPEHLAGAGRLLGIAAKVGELVRKADTGPSWREKAQAALVSAERTDIVGRYEGMLRAAKIGRDSGSVDADTTAYLILICIDELTAHRWEADPERKRLDQAIVEANAAHGLKEDEEWETPPDHVRQLEDAYERRFTEIEAAVYREYGEADLYNQQKTDPTFWDRMEQVRARIFGPLPNPASSGDCVSELKSKGVLLGQLSSRV